MKKLNVLIVSLILALAVGMMPSDIWGASQLKPKNAVIKKHGSKPFSQRLVQEKTYDLSKVLKKNMTLKVRLSDGKAKIYVNGKRKKSLQDKTLGRFNDMEARYIRLKNKEQYVWVNGWLGATGQLSADWFVRIKKNGKVKAYKRQGFVPEDEEIVEFKSKHFVKVKNNTVVMDITYVVDSYGSYEWKTYRVTYAKSGNKFAVKKYTEKSL